MRIVNSVLGDATGGRWQVVCDYTRVLGAQGHQVLTLLGQTYPPDSRRLPPAARVLTLRNRGHYDFPAAWRARKQLREFAPDIAIAHCSRSVALLRRALAGRAPLVAVSHSNKVKRLLPADAYLALTHHIEERIRAHDRRGSSRPCFVIPNMVDVPGAGPLPPRGRHTPLRIGALGRFDPVKGFDVFLEALAGLKAAGLEFEAVLGGAGVEEGALREQAQQLGLGQQLRFPGWIEDTRQFLEGLDMLCVPARSDAFGLTPLQAAAAGVPLVLSRVSGHSAMFREDREALFSEAGDPRSTALQLAQLASYPELGERLRQAAHHRVIQAYSVTAVTGELINALETILKSQ